MGSGTAVYATFFAAGDSCRQTLETRDVDTSARRRELRQGMAERRRNLSPPQRMAAAQGLRRSLDQLPEFHTDARVAGYWACDGELPLNLAVAPLAARGQRFLLPLIGKDGELRFAPWSSGDDVQANRFGIPEPVAPTEWFAAFQLDLVLMPLLAFDRRGNRLGYGGGYYDRSFAFLKDQLRPTEPLLVGIGYDFQELPAITAEAWDIPLDFIATDRELIDCRHDSAEGSAV